jgi:hypothetical protein
MKEAIGTRRIEPAFEISPFTNKASATLEVLDLEGAVVEEAVVEVVASADTTINASEKGSIGIDDQSFEGVRFTRRTRFERRVASFVRAPCFDSIPIKQSLQRKSVPFSIRIFVIPERPHDAQTNG